MKITLEIVNQTVLLHKEFETPTLHRIFFEILKYVFLSEVSHGSSCDYFALKTQILQRYYYFLAAGNQKFQWVKCDSYTRMMQMMQMNPPDDWLKTGWARDSQTRTRLMDSLFCIKCSVENNVVSVLHYVIKVTLHCLRDSFCLGTSVHGFILLPPRSLASSRGCSFEIIEPREYSMESNHWDEAAFPKLWIFFLILANCVDSMLFHCFYYF